MSWTREQIKAKAAAMRANAQRADDYGTWRSETDAADAWEARQLQAVGAQ